MDLEEMYAAFADFMTPEEDGTPVLLPSNLRHVLEALGIPSGLAPKLQLLMDPKGTGKIGFEEFAEVCREHIDSFEDNEDSEEEYIPDRVKEEPVGRQEEMFRLLSNKHGRITLQSLARVQRKLKLDVPVEDLEKMTSMASSEEEFYGVWNELSEKLTRTRTRVNRPRSK